jgi:gas vesicle protein
MRMFARILLAALLCLAAATVFAADDNADLKKQIDELKSMVKQIQADYEQKIEALQKQIEELSAKAELAEITQQTQSEIMDAVQQEAVTSARTAAAAGGAQQTMNPDISAILDWSGSLYSPTNENKNGFDLREVELGFSGEIDPYARADVFIGIPGAAEEGEPGIDIEEAYLTVPHLTSSLQGKAGKFLAEFGRANTTHLHAFPWVDCPLPYHAYLGDEGLHGVGVSFAYLLPTHHFSELTLQGFDADGASFLGRDSNKLTYLAHWSNFFALSPASSLAVGASYATGPNDAENTDLTTTLWGADLTYKWRPPQEGLYKSLWWQSEGYWCKRELADADAVNAWGMYSSLVYQFERRRSVGLRYDYVEDPLDNSLHTRQWAANLTLTPSEFQFWRLEYRHLDPNFGGSEHQWWLQYDAGIGPHRAHKW